MVVLNSLLTQLLQSETRFAIVPIQGVLFSSIVKSTCCIVQRSALCAEAYWVQAHWSWCRHTLALL